MNDEDRTNPEGGPNAAAKDAERLHRLGYEQELARVLGGFSNYAISLSIICILAGGITSFHLGYCGVGGAAIGIGWPLVALFSLAVAATMGQVASAFPTAGGLYHWASILGGRGWGWATAWFNLAGLVTVLAAINVGTVDFALQSLGPRLGIPADSGAIRLSAVALITFSHALFNHLGIKATARLTDFSGYWIVGISTLLAIAMLVAGWGELEPARLWTFANYSGTRGGDVWPETSSLAWLFALGFLLPAYTITGFDASAHAAEETVEAARNVPRGIVRSVVVSGIAGWIMLSAVVMAIPDPDAAASKGASAFAWIMDRRLSSPVATALFAGIVLAQYLCGLATVTSASRMTYAFARDGGLPGSGLLRRVSADHKVPAAAIWSVATAAVLFTLYTPVYSTITAVCTILLYISYVLPTALGVFAYKRTWTEMGPWGVGAWYRPLAVLSVLGCAALIVIGMQPPNEKAVWVVGGFVALLALGWFGWSRRRFPGPPAALQLGSGREGG